MRAVNLLPSDLRGAAPKPAPGARQEKAEGIGAYVVLGVLALCVAALAAYILTDNTVKDRTADLASAQSRAATATAKAAALKPYADFEAMANTRIETVRQLAAARFDWERALRDLARAVPRDVKLSSLNGDMGLPGAQGAESDPLRGSIKAPAITLIGCASSQVGVARMMARVKAVDGVTRVALSKSEKAMTAGAAPTDQPCEGKEPPTFSMVAFFEGSAAAAALTPADAAAAEPVPVPNALAPAQADGTAAQTPAGDETSSDQPAASAAAAGDAADQPQGAATSSTTTTGGTP